MAKTILTIFLLVAINARVFGAQLKGVEQPSYLPDGPEFSSKDVDETTYANAVAQNTEAPKVANLTTTTNETSQNQTQPETTTMQMTSESTATTPAAPTTPMQTTTPSEMQPTAQPISGAPSVIATSLMSLFPLILGCKYFI